MHIQVFRTKEEMGQAAAEKGTEILVNAIERKGKTVFVVASAASQREFLQSLVSMGSVDWSKSVMFHLDEYIGLPKDHPANFRRFLKEMLVNKVHPGTVYFIEGDAKDPEAECQRLNEIINLHELDAAFIGIGENGHLAFNDPPADLNTEDPFIVVELDQVSRKQQVGEGWFATLDEVPLKAISMSIPQIMKFRNIVCTVPDRRKAEAVKNTIEGAISPAVPASILRKHNDVFMFLDRPAAEFLKRSDIEKYSGI